MEKEARYRLKKVSRKGKKAEPENEGYIQELRVPARSRRQTESGDERLYHEISPSPGHTYNLHKYETRTPEEYISRATSAPRIVRKISEPVTRSSRGGYEHQYRQSLPRHPSWVEFEEYEDEVQEEVVRDTDRQTRRDARQEVEQERYITGERTIREDTREEPGRASEGEHRMEFDADPRSRRRRRQKAGKRAQTKPEVGADSIVSVQLASENLHRFGGEDPRKYMELRYGVLVEPTEKSIEEIEEEADFERQIKRSSAKPARRFSYATRRKESEIRLQEMEMRMEMDTGKRMKTKMEHEAQLISDPSDLSSSSNDSSDDEQIQAMLQAASISDNVCIPDTPYEPQTEAFRREQEKEKRAYSVRMAADERVAEEKEAAAAARQRAQSLRDLERTIRERETFVASQEESILRRQAALEERERRAAAQERELDERLRERMEREREGEGGGEPSRRRNVRPRAREYLVDDDILDVEPPSSSSRSRFARDGGEEDQWYKP